jgi:radical SAM protein with 4Fe4S-binding SPASM domain
MCKYGRRPALPELDTDTLLRVLTDAAQLGCRKVHFSGGEVLVRRDFARLLSAATDAKMKVTFTSNLTLLTKERAKEIFEHKISGVSTSLDGATAKEHDAIRGVPGSFKRTLRAIETLTRYRERGRPRLRINFVLMRHNFREYPELVRLAGELGASDVVPMPVDTKQERLRLSKRLIRTYNEEVAPLVLEARTAAGLPTDTASIHPFGTTKTEVELSSAGHYAGGYYRDHLCYAPYLHAFIAWDGNVYPCCMTNGRIDALGNVQASSIMSIFRGNEFSALRSRMQTCRLPSCHDCDMHLTENRVLDCVLVGTRVSAGTDECPPTP